ncbi:Mitogen-activated protein kinase kinase kinase YODA [Heracleum sosnowskyi]|uniref:Mitogen-activated protein kinase kinase kinase YODA n=1 Tax=Heracleum sosnowskyi TaxID=360622 RepID=A0AAD8M399_9APIA|nr:Mitogen-activated protein kinase kinase kinase YODA [Heracleum sosnowskyi]KAK1360390.1 Mitogen-activated protein kinase kinase kinase YODA [Heracleum sosnowskyi]
MASKWLLSKFLGAGSYGSVFLGQCVSPSLTCYYNSPTIAAIKSSLQTNSWSLKLEKAVLYELRGCPEIVRYFPAEDFDIVNEYGDKFHNIVLEYADGGTLTQLIKSRGGWIPEYEASWYARMMLKGLSHVHHRGFVHCDLKPDNVLVFNVPSGEGKGVVKYNLKLADFGLAKRSGGVSCGAGGEYKNRGTLLYSSPESVVFGIHETAMDVWSLGCMLLEMLLGKGGLWNRFIDVDGQCLAEMIANYEDDRLNMILPKFDYLSVNAKDFVRRCLKQNVKERWTAEELLKHPFISHNQNLLKKFEAQLSYKKMIKYQSSTALSYSFASSHISLGVC